MEKELELLNNIHPVDAPPFLWSRIEQKIRNKQSEILSPRITFTLAAATLLLILLNTVFLVSTSRPSPETDLTKSMNLFQDNLLYK